MNITIPVPGDLDQAAAHRAELEAREAADVRLYRDGQFSRGQLAKFLGVDRAGVDKVLDRHAVGILSGVTAKEIAEQSDALRGSRQRQEVEQRFNAVVEKVEKRFGRMLKRLAEK